MSSRMSLDRAIQMIEQHVFPTEECDLAARTVLDALDRYHRAFMEEIGEPVPLPVADREECEVPAPQMYRRVQTWPTDFLVRRHEAGDHDLGRWPDCPLCVVGSADG